MNIEIFPYNGPRYREALLLTKEALTASNLRSRDPDNYPKPTKAQRKALNEYHEWMRVVAQWSDREWFRRINRAIEEKFYRAYIFQIVWWWRCEKHERNPIEKFDPDAWRKHFEGWDFEQALFTDWDMMEYALHCAGFPPFKANSLAFQCVDRQRWLDTYNKTYRCFECDAESTNNTYPPQICRACKQHGTMEEV